MSSIHSVLDKEVWNVNEMRSLLEKDATSINKMDSLGSAPLHRVLKDLKCSVEIVELFLHYGANPNQATIGGVYPLIISLHYKRNTEINRMLLFKGAEVNVRDGIRGHPPLCIALRNNPDFELIQILLDAGSSPKDCRIHDSALYCIKPNSELSLDVCKLMIKRDPSIINKVDVYKRSLLCYALTWNTEPDTIKFLLEAGCSLDACQTHNSALVCACVDAGPLKKGTIQLLLDAGATIVKSFISPLNLALEHRSYDTDAIELLYKYETENDVDDDFYLNNAVKNLNCKPSTLQYLIDHGAEVYFGHNLLIYAVENENCQPGVIQVLLNTDCNINIPYGRTALAIAISRRMSLEIVEMLLKGGSRLEATGKRWEILQKALDKYDLDPSQENINFLKMLLKYAYLENPKFKIKDLFQGRKHYRTFSDFENECAQEIRLLKSNNIFQFIGRYSDYKPKAKGDQLLKVPSVNNFAVYFDVICSTFGKKAVDMRLQLQPISYIVFDSQCLPRKLVLNYEIVLKIVDFLSEEDKFSLLVALYDIDSNKPTSYSKKIGLSEENSKTPTELHKRLPKRRRTK